MEDFERVERMFSSAKGPEDSFQIGRDVVALLENAPAAAEQEEQRARLLLRGYNWAGRHIDGFELAKLAVKKWGNGFLPDLNTALVNAFWWPGDLFLAKADELIELGLGSEVLWRLRKADFLQMEATGERHKEQEWQPGDPIVDAAALAQEATELKRALACVLPQPLVEDWDSRFAPLLEQTQYAALRPVPRSM